MPAYLELTRSEAVALAYLLREWDERGKALRVRLFDAVLQLEAGVTSPFSIAVDEGDCWYLDMILREDSKDLLGSSLQPLLRRVWQLLVGFHKDELMQVPDLPVSKVTGRTYREAYDAANKRTGEDGAAGTAPV